MRNGFLLLIGPALGLAVAAAARAEDQAVVIGVKSYDGPSGLSSLSWTESDALEIGQALRRAGYNVRVLTDTSEGDFVPTRKNILARVGDAKRDAIPRRSNLVVFLAGHGKMVTESGKERGAFCPKNIAMRGKNLYDNLVYIDEVADLMDDPRLPRKYLFVDACRDKDRNRGGDDAYEVPAGDELPSPGVQTVFSCESRQVSKEREELRHGLFSYYLIRGLRGKADHISPDSVTLGELFGYVKFRMTKYGKANFIDQVPKQLRAKAPGQKDEDIDSQPIVTLRPDGWEGRVTPDNVGDYLNSQPSGGNIVFRNLTFTGRFVGQSFSYAKFVDCHFENCTIRGVPSLYEASMHDCTFENSDFKRVDCSTLKIYGTPPPAEKTPWKEKEAKLIHTPTDD